MMTTSSTSHETGPVEKVSANALRPGALGARIRMACGTKRMADATMTGTTPAVLTLMGM